MQTIDWVLIFLILIVGVAGVFASRQAHRRGRREAELEAAPLREKSVDLDSRLRETENRLEKDRASLQEALNQKSTLEEKCERIPRLEEELRDFKGRVERSTADLLEINRNNERLQTELEGLHKREPQIRETLRLELSQLAAKFLEEKGTAFAKQNLESLDNLLKPLGVKLKDFENRIENVYGKEAEQRISLKKEIEILNLANQRISQDAQNLASALKGQNKTGGNWGEVILERVLEKSGLTRGREYEVQQSLADEGGRKQPDVVIHLPENKHMIVDAKLSLAAYERFCSAETPEQAEIELKAHIVSLRRHVDGLSTKRYQDLYGIQSLDFVFLFMPVEPAFIVAVQKDLGLFQEAFDRNIVIVSPSTLLASLRTVASIWKQEHQNRNVHEIARQAGALYDKFVGFLEDLEGVGKGLATAQSSFEGAKNKLSEGKGNLISRVERLKELRAKTSKEIPKPWKDALEEDSEISDNRLPV